MSPKTDTDTQAASRDLIITRTFDAPTALVWRAWTDPTHLMKWWGPKNFTSPTCKIDLRVGGKFLFCMRSADGQDYWSTGEIRELIPMQRLVYTDHFADKDGNVVSAADYGLPGEWPDETLVTVMLEAKQGKTTMTLRHTGIPAGTASDMTGAGWNESLDKFAESLR